MNVTIETHRSRSRARTHVGIGAAAIAAAVLAGTAGCAGASTPSPPSTGLSTASSGASAAGLVSLPASGSSAASPAAISATTASAAAAPTTAAAAGGGTPACGNADLAVSLGSGSAGMSHQGLALKFTNVAKHSCTLVGYPGAAVVSGGKTLLNATRELNGYIGDERQLGSAPKVTLDPGASASAELEWVVNAGEQCYPNGSGALVVTPPNTTKSTSLRTMTVGTSGLCAGFEVHPVVPGDLAG